MRKKQKIIISIILLLSIILFLLFGLTRDNYAYGLYIRTPKLIAIILTGSSIGFSSIIFQTITNNRILTPGILGLDSLYIFIQTLIVFLLGQNAYTKVNENFQFIISILLMIFFSVFILGKALNILKSNIHYFLLVGLISGTFFKSSASFIQAIIDPNEFLLIQGKMFASFSNINLNILIVSSILLIFSFIYAWKFKNELDVMALGKDQAVNLGIDYNILVKKLLFSVSIMISVATALVGPITFLGILITNLSREILKTYKHKDLILVSMALGIISLVLGQFLVEKLFQFSVPVSVIINFIGGIYFIYILLKENKL